MSNSFIPNSYDPFHFSVPTVSSIIEAPRRTYINEYRENDEKSTGKVKRPKPKTQKLWCDAVQEAFTLVRQRDPDNQTLNKSALKRGSPMYTLVKHLYKKKLEKQFSATHNVVETSRKKGCGLKLVPKMK